MFPWEYQQDSNAEISLPSIAMVFHKPTWGLLDSNMGSECEDPNYVLRPRRPGIWHDMTNVNNYWCSQCSPWGKKLWTWTWICNLTHEMSWTFLERPVTSRLVDRRRQHHAIHIGLEWLENIRCCLRCCPLNLKRKPLRQIRIRIIDQSDEMQGCNIGCLKPLWQLLKANIEQKK